jgi:hypothetical protein
MKVTKSLLLGAAAGLVAMSGAQAADLPVKAKAVEYVKICSAYGAGFYYIPGTDICLRVGGYVYLEFGVKGANAVANIYSTNDGVINASYDYFNWRSSARVILDARNNTSYGTLRAYMVVGAQHANNANVVGYDAAFIQFAGFTWGFTNSFFSFLGGASQYGIVALSSVDWSWINTFAYTANLGNGVTASLAMEDGRGRRTAILGVTGAGYGGGWAPDVVGNIKVVQTWGQAQIMAAAHQVKPNSWLSGSGSVGGPYGSKWGYAVGAGIEMKTPQTGNPNNSWFLQGVWSEGAANYTGLDSGPGGGATVFSLGEFAGTGPLYPVTDAAATGGGTLRLTEAWSVHGAYRHYWTPALRTAFIAGYVEVDAHASLTGTATAPIGDVEVIQAGTSTVWSPVPGLDLSLDLIWSEVEQTSTFGKRKNDLFTAWSRLRRNF